MVCGGQVILLNEDVMMMMMMMMNTEFVIVSVDRPYSKISLFK